MNCYEKGNSRNRDVVDKVVEACVINKTDNRPFLLFTIQSELERESAVCCPCSPPFLMMAGCKIELRGQRSHGDYKCNDVFSLSLSLIYYSFSFTLLLQSVCCVCVCSFTEIISLCPECMHDNESRMDGKEIRAQVVRISEK